MKTYLVVTVTCLDHPGIVERITDVVAAHGANWEESRMARLGGDFAGIVKVSVSNARANALTNALKALANEEMSIAVKVTSPTSPEAAGGAQFCELRLSGADHEGIVHKVAAYLASHGVNVESMETEVVLAPISGSPLFQMHAEIKVPRTLSVAELKASLEDVGHELGVDIEVTTARATAS